MTRRLLFVLLAAGVTAGLAVGCDDIRSDIGLEVTLDRTTYGLGDTVWIELANPRPDTVRYLWNLCHEVYRRDAGAVEFTHWSWDGGSGTVLTGCPWQAMHSPQEISPGGVDTTFVSLRPASYDAGEYQVAILGYTETDGKRALTPWFSVVEP